MSTSFTLSQLRYRFGNDNACLEEIRRLRFPDGIYCVSCKRITKHYKIERRTAYSCKFCRSHVYPLKDTIFEKTTTPLQVWFVAMYLMTQTRGTVSAKQLERELNVSYKTAWRIKKRIFKMMEADTSRKLNGVFDYSDPNATEESTIRRWSFFNAIEITFVQKEKKTG